MHSTKYELTEPTAAELSWPMRLRVTAAIAAGVILIGVLAWPVVAPGTPFGTVSIVQVDITVADVGVILLAGFAAGAAGYFVCWPYGRQIAILAAPAGLAVWALKTGSMADLLRLMPTAPQRQAVYATIKWEGLLWFAVVAAGFCGMLAAEKTAGKRPAGQPGPRMQTCNVSTVANFALAVLASAVIALFCVGFFARGVELADPRVGSVLAQPETGQIAFGVLVAFSIAGFVAKNWLSASYYCPIIATAVVSFMSVKLSERARVLGYLAANWPAAFCAKPVALVLPIQIIAFGSLGAVAGYWLAVKYELWRKYHGSST